MLQQLTITKMKMVYWSIPASIIYVRNQKAILRLVGSARKIRHLSGHLYYVIYLASFIFFGENVVRTPILNSGRITDHKVE